MFYSLYDQSCFTLNEHISIFNPISCLAAFPVFQNQVLSPVWQNNAKGPFGRFPVHTAALWLVTSPRQLGQRIEAGARCAFEEVQRVVARGACSLDLLKEIKIGPRFLTIFSMWISNLRLSCICRPTSFATVSRSMIS